MCGIVGQFQRDGPLDRERLRSASRCIEHRGPDGDGFWYSPDGRLGLAHKRLAIVDLSDRASQPMRDDASDTTLVFNGEIYNFREVRRELGHLGHAFRTESDSEVILAAYQQWGDACLDRLSGMFAFCIADLPRNELFIARDRVGEKPLFHCATEHAFSFASELKALLALPGVPRRMDPHALNSYLALGYVPGEQCILAGVRKLPAGHAMRVSLDSLKVRAWRYWRLPAEDPRPELTEDQAADELLPLLTDAVRHQLVADVPVGVLLSGGLDSSLISALAARVSAQPIRTFSVGFPGYPHHDESQFARLVAKSVGSLHTELAVTPASSDVLGQLAAHYDEPMADSSMIPTYLLARVVREHVTVALGGDGGDELFGGYPHYSWMQRLERVKQVVPSPFRRIAAAAASTLPTGVRGRNYVVGFGGELGYAFARTNLYFDAAHRRRLMKPLASASIDWGWPEMLRAHSGDDGGSVADRVRRIDFRTYLPDDILVKVDRASMLSSLEVRAPFLDRRVCEFAFRLPGRLTATEHSRKVVLRRLAQRLLSPEFNATRKQGFSIPLDAWLRGSWRSVFEDALASLPRTLFAPDAVRAVARSAQGQLANSHRVFALAMLGLWRQHYSIEDP